MFYETYLDLCQKKAVSPTRAAMELGISKASPTTWKNWKKRGLTPQAGTLNKIADYFGVTTDYLLKGENKNNPTSAHRSKTADEIVELVRRLPLAQQEFILAQIKGILFEREEQKLFQSVQ